MQKFRCPLCGLLASGSRLAKDFDIEIYAIHGLGYGRGFAKVSIVNPELVSLVKAKIARLYDRFIGIPVKVSAVVKLPLRSKLPIITRGSSMTRTPWCPRG